MARRGVCLLAAILLVLGACGDAQVDGAASYTGSEAAIAEPTAEATSVVDIYGLEVGDCWNDPEGGFENPVDLLVTVVACSEPHDNEVFHQFEMPDGAFPDHETFVRTSDPVCTETFEAFVGIGYEESELYWLWIGPDEASWNKLGDRTVTCSVFDGSGEQISGTAEGLAR